MSQPTFSVSVLIHNHWRAAVRCLDSIDERTNHQGVELILTDNGSRPEVAREISNWQRRRQDWVRLIRHRENLGVIRGKNYALEVAAGRYFVSLDSDTRVGKGWIHELVRPVMLDPLCVQVGRVKGAYRHLLPSGAGTETGPVDYIDGSCFLVVAEVACAYGLCDEAYEFAYCEDSDFSLRVRKAGWTIALAPAIVEHEGHVTAGPMDLRRYYNRNHRLFMQRWGAFLRDRTFGHVGEPPVRPAEELLASQIRL